MQKVISFSPTAIRRIQVIASRGMYSSFDNNPSISCDLYDLCRITRAKLHCDYVFSLRLN